MARLLLLLLLVLPVSPTFAQAPCEIGTASDTLDANNVRASLYNNGLLFSNRSGNIYNVPKAPPGQPIQPNALWVANLWFGGYIGSKLVNATTGYATGQFNPGPLNPQGRPFSDCTRYDRIFKVTLADIQALRTGTITEAVRAWPWAWGAPVSDGDGVPDNYNLGGSDRPELMGTESHWWVMNAMGPHGRRDSFPLEVQVTAFAMPSLPTFQARIPAIYNSTLYRYRLLWRGAAPMTGVHVGFYLDPDVGNASDDYVGSDTTLRMGFAYNADNFDEGPFGYGVAPPAVGVLALAGPPVYDDDGDGVPETAGLTASQYFSEPYCTPPGCPEHLNLMRGLNEDGSPMTRFGDGTCLWRRWSSCPPNAPITRWKFSGDPVTRSFWSEYQPTPGGVPNAPTERRMTFGTGPFVLQPGAVQDVVFAFVWARGTDHLDSIAKLRRDAAALMDVWRSGGYMAYARQAASEPIEVPRPTLAVGAVMPSPVRGAASLRVSLPVAATVRVWVVDALGRTVARLHEGSMDMGTHPVALDGSLLAPGVYAARVSIGGETVSRPFVVVR